MVFAMHHGLQTGYGRLDDVARRRRQRSANSAISARALVPADAARTRPVEPDGTRTRSEDAASHELRAAASVQLLVTFQLSVAVERRLVADGGVGVVADNRALRRELGVPRSRDPQQQPEACSRARSVGWRCFGGANRAFRTCPRTGSTGSSVTPSISPSPAHSGRPPPGRRTSLRSRFCGPAIASPRPN